MLSQKKKKRDEQRGKDTKKILHSLCSSYPLHSCFFFRALFPLNLMPLVLCIMSEFQFILFVIYQLNDDHSPRITVTRLLWPAFQTWSTTIKSNAPLAIFSFAMRLPLVLVRLNIANTKSSLAPISRHRLICCDVKTVRHWLKIFFFSEISSIMRNLEWTSYRFENSMFLVLHKYLTLSLSDVTLVVPFLDLHTHSVKPTRAFQCYWIVFSFHTILYDFTSSMTSYHKNYTMNDQMTCVIQYDAVRIQTSKQIIQNTQSKCENDASQCLVLK